MPRANSPDLARFRLSWRAPFAASCASKVGIRLAHVQAPSGPQVDRWLVALLVLWEAEDRSRQADRGAGRLHLQRVRRPLWRDPSEGAEAGKVMPITRPRRSRYFPLADPCAAEPAISGSAKLQSISSCGSHSPGGGCQRDPLYRTYRNIC